MSAGTATVDRDEAGIRLDRWFKRRYPHIAHGPLEKLLRTGQVRIDGKRAKAGDRLEPGQSIRIPPQIVHATPADRPPPKFKDDDAAFMQGLILHEDQSVFVLNKPPGLPTQGGSGVTRHIDGLLGALQGNKRQKPKLVHRLDRDTSGVLVVARTSPAAAALSESLRRRDARKIYWALVRGLPSPPTGVIRLALAKEGGRGEERMEAAEEGDEGAKDATTHYAVMDAAAYEYAWVAASPVTGRTHQIRAHLAALGTPIVGDSKYGNERSRGTGEIADKLHLHARAIDIAHPDGGRLRVTAPLPPHMKQTWKLFGFSVDDKRDPFGPAKKK
jgi:23S rRNA pseudouridine955/2504/2580 synthase